MVPEIVDSDVDVVEESPFPGGFEVTSLAGPETGASITGVDGGSVADNDAVDSFTGAEGGSFADEGGESIPAGGSDVGGIDRGPFAGAEDESIPVGGSDGGGPEGGSLPDEGDESIPVGDSDVGGVEGGSFAVDEDESKGADEGEWLMGIEDLSFCVDEAFMFFETRLPHRETLTVGL